MTRYGKQPPEVFCKKKGVPRNFAKFIGKHLCQCLFFNKVVSAAINGAMQEFTSKIYNFSEQHEESSQQ